MLNVFVKKGVLGDGPVIGERFPFVPGETPRTLVARVADHLPKSVPIDVAMFGRLLTEEEYDTELRDGDEVVFCGHVAAGVDLVALLVQAIITAALSVAVNYALQALNPQPTVPDVPQERGDETSQTYAWSGIQTNYGQGFIVPAIYGRHGIGGQVITTDVDTGETSGGYLVDQLNVLLALSEGPIDKIGDREVSDVGDDFLGSIVTNPGKGSLPKGIRVNDVMLVNEGDAVVAQLLAGNTWFNNNDPDLRAGDVLFLWNKSLGVQVAGTERIAKYTYSGPSTVVSTNAVVTIWMASIPTAWEQAANDPANYNLRLSTTPGDPGEFFLLGSWAADTLAPNVAGALAYLRKGTLDQPPMPGEGSGTLGPWIGAAVTFSPGNTLNEFGNSAVFAYNTGDDPVQRVVFTIAAPVGIYAQDQEGNIEPFTVDLQFTWRYEGETGWRNFSNPSGQQIGTQARTGPFLYTITRGIDNVTGNIEVRVLRTSASGGIGSVSSLLWRDVSFGTGYALAYPRVACLGLTLEANARWNGGLPSFNVLVDGIKLRVHDSVSDGWSPRTWEVPAAPYDWHTHPPGRNPAWILLDFLLADWGLGHYLKESDIDLPAFERWAVFCDQDPNPNGTLWNEPRFTCDLVLDRARAAWEWVLAICATGRASPVFVDGKVSVVYEYRDAHAQGNVSVPAKSVTQLFTTGNISDMTVTWLPRADRPTSFVYQFLNEAFEYRQDVIPFEDAEATFNDSTELFPDEYRPQQVQAFGQTRVTQLYRDSVYRHRVNRLVTRKVDFKTGRWALASSIGDLIDIEAEVLRPFPVSPASTVADVADACTVWEDAASSNTLLVDRANIPASGAIKIRQPDGTPVVTTYTLSAALPPVNGVPIALIATAATLTVDKGAPCVIGTVDKLTQTYQIVAVTVNNDLTHTITALQWVPELHDDIDPGDYEDGTASSLIAEPPAYSDDGNVFDRELMVNATGASHLVEFARLPQRQSVPARVYVRNAKDQVWEVAGVTEGNQVDIGKRRAHQEIQVALAVETMRGHSRPPEMGRIVTMKVPEFTQVVPPPVTNPVWHEIQGTLMLTWDEITTKGVAFYEIREGVNWNGGRVIARTSDTRFVFEVPTQASNVMVAVQMRDGSQGEPLRVPATPTWEPYDTYKTVARDELALHTGSATMDGVEIGASAEVTLSANQFTGTYTTDDIDAGWLGPMLWRVNIEAHEYDAATVNDLDFALASGEASWWTVDGRGASPGLPGVDWQRTVDDLADLTVDSLQDELVHGPRGEAGSHTRVLLESRFSEDGEAWDEWAEHIDGTRVAQYAQFRLTLDRETLMHEAQVHEFVIVAHA